MTEEETIFDDELNDDFLPTASNEGGEGELYEHFECSTPVVIVFRRLPMRAISM